MHYTLISYILILFSMAITIFMGLVFVQTIVSIFKELEHDFVSHHRHKENEKHGNDKQGRLD